MVKPDALTPAGIPPLIDRELLATTADQRASNAERRAERARQHAAMAIAHAEQDASDGNGESHTLHRREAELHARAASHHTAAAELQRLHAAHLRASDGGTPPTAKPAPRYPPRSR